MYRCHCSERFYNEADFEEHKKICKTRYFPCSLCDETVSSYDMSYHLSRCGSKTTKCSKCQKYIKRSMYAYHLDNNCVHLDEDEEISISNHSKTATQQNSTASAEIINFNDEYKPPRNLNTIRQKQDYEELLLTNNDPQIDDIFLIPCEFCNEQIKSSLYDFHVTSCSRHGRNYSSIIRQSTHRNSQINETLDTPKPNKEEIDTKLINSSTSNKSLCKETAVSHLHEKAAQVHNMLGDNYYPTEINHVTDKVQFNIVLTGSPRVGKSQLINALSNGEIKAKTSPGLNACTAEVQCYVLEDNQQRTPGIKPFRINFYDTPGIESWTDGSGQTTMLKFIEEKDPVCLIYCASPGSFADLKQLRPVLEFCQKKHIFCALVCANMWSNPSRKVVIEEFQNELVIFGEPIEKSFKQENDQSPHKVTVFGDGALCTMVNSVEFYDPELSSEAKPVQGIDELIYCIMEELDHEKLLGWCNAVLYRRSFWEKLSQKVNGYFSLRVPNPNLPSFMAIEQFARDFALRLYDKFRK